MNVTYRIIVWGVIAALFIGAHLFTYTVLRSVRGIIISESFWSKTEKETVESLFLYAADPKPEHLQSYRNGLERMGIFKEIRLELSNTHPDWKRARSLLSQINGGQHTPQIIYFFNFGRSFRVSQDVLQLWKSIDDKVEELEELGSQLIAEVNSQRKPGPVLDKIAELDKGISVTSTAFALRLDRSVDILESSLLAVTLVFSVALVVLGFATNRIIRNRIHLTQKAYQFFIEDFPAVYLVLDEGLNIISMNPFGYRNLGIDQKDLIGKQVDSIFDAREKPALLNQARIALRHPEQTRPFRSQLKLINGNTIWVQGSMKGVIRPDDSHNVLILLQDITIKERETTERLRFLSAIEASSNEIYIIDPSSLKFLYANKGARKNLGYRKSELKQLTPLDLKPEIGYDELHDQLHSLRSGSAAEVHWETIHQRSDGKTYPVHETVHYINDEAFPVFVSVVTDISELKRTEDALRNSYQEQRTLLRETNHRIKNNLHLVSTLFEIQAKATEDRKYQQFLHETVNRLHSLMLLHDQLYLAHQQEVLSFSIYVDNLISRLKDTFGVRDVKFKLNIPDIQMSSFAAIHCGLIINELVTNSLKYAFRHMQAEEEKRINVELEDLGSHDFRLMVCDNGSGIPIERLDSEGGMGLRLIKMLSRQLSGSIEVENSQGTKYTISLTDQVISET